MSPAVVASAGCPEEGVCLNDAAPGSASPDGASYGGGNVGGGGPGVYPDAARQGSDGQLWLRDELYRRLPSKRISELLEADSTRARREVAAVLEQLLEEGEWAGLSAAEHQELSRKVLDSVTGFGPIEPLLADARVTEIMVNGPDRVFFERDGKIEPSTLRFIDETQLRQLIDRILGPLGRRVDEATPIVSARLPEGHRVHVVIPPLALDGPVLSIRKFRAQMYTLAELVELESMDEEIAAVLEDAVKKRQSIVVSGGTGSGKTTLLNALSVAIPTSERIITIEDAAELRFHAHPHVVRLEARSSSIEGSGEVTIRDLVTSALRMRPDRIVVGECRGAETLDMLQAMNTGHDGSLTTLHANSPSEAVSRLVMMCRFGMDLPVDVLYEQIASAFDLIVQLERDRHGRRRVVELCSCAGGRNGVELTCLHSFNPQTEVYERPGADGGLA